MIVTIMIPTFNQDQFILDAINSALAQSYENLEIIVGDDHSTDSTYDIIKKLNNKRITYVRNKENLGRVKNYRKLLKLSRGKYFVNLDGDDYFTDRNFIRDAAARLAEDASLIMVVAQATRAGQKRRKTSLLPKVSKMRGMEVVKGLPRRPFQFMHMACVMNRVEALKLDFYRSDALSSDWESIYRLAVHGNVGFLHRNIGVWRQHERNESKVNDLDDLIENISIWKSIFDEARSFGMNQINYNISLFRCISYFSLINKRRIKFFNREEFDRYINFVRKDCESAGLYLRLNRKIGRL